MEERILLNRLKKRRVSALEYVISRYESYVFTVCRNRSRGMLPEQDCEEISADVFFALWEQADRVQPGHLRPWLGSVARNKTVDRLRQRSIELPLEENLTLSADSLFEAMSDRERSDVVRAALSQLSAQDQDIFYRYYDLCQSARQIGEDLSMNPSTVRARLHRGRETVKKHLYERGYFYENEIG